MAVSPVLLAPGSAAPPRPEEKNPLAGMVLLTAEGVEARAKAGGEITRNARG